MCGEDVTSILIFLNYSFYKKNTILNSRQSKLNELHVMLIIDIVPFVHKFYMSLRGTLTKEKIYIVFETHLKKIVSII